MSALGEFRALGLIASAAVVALGCTLVSHHVSSTRAELRKVETEIALAQRDIRLLGTEIGTRGRLAQLERWNVKVLSLSAPAEQQFVADSFQLATLVGPPTRTAVDAPLVLASAPAQPADGGAAPAAGPPAAPRPGGDPAQMLHVASYRTTPQGAASRPALPGDRAPAATTARVTDSAAPAATAKPSAATGKTVTPTAKASPVTARPAAAKPVPAKAAGAGAAPSSARRDPLAPDPVAASRRPLAARGLTAGVAKGEGARTASPPARPRPDAAGVRPVSAGNAAKPAAKSSQKKPATA